MVDLTKKFKRFRKTTDYKTHITNFKHDLVENINKFVVEEENIEKRREQLGELKEWLNRNFPTN